MEEDVGSIETYMGKVEEAYSKLASCHEDICAKLENEDEIKEAELYISNETIRMEEALQSAEESFMGLKVKTSKEGKSRVGREIQCGLTFFHQSTESLQLSLGSAVERAPTLPHDQVVFVKSELRSQLDTVRAAHKAYSILVTSSDEEDVFLKSLTDHVNRFCMEVMGVERNEPRVRTPAVHAPAPKIEAIAIPKFDGSYGQWPSFLESWTMVVETYYPREFWGIILKSKLSGEAAELVNAYEKYDDMIAGLKRKYGDKRKICEHVIETIRSVKPVQEGDYSGFIQFVDVVEKADTKLRSLGLIGEINNTVSMAEIERRIPDDIKSDWARLIVKTPETARQNSYELLLNFLREERERVDYLKSDARNSRTQKKFPTKSATSQVSISKETMYEMCQVCKSDKHPIWMCEKFRKMNMKDRRDQVLSLRLCFRCMQSGHNARSCTHPKPRLCRTCNRHNFMLPCVASKSEVTPRKGSLVQELEEARKRVEQLTEKLKTQQKATTHKASDREKSTSSTTNHVTAKSSVPTEVDNVILMLQYAYTSNGNKIGVLWDNASDTNYCTHELAKKLGLRGEPYTLHVDGIGKMKTSIETYRYILKLRSEEGVVKVVAYGLDNITSVKDPVSAEALRVLFKKYPVKLFERPRKCDILLSQANASLMPNKESINENLVLWKGPLGYVVGGSHTCLVEEAELSVKSSSTHLALSLFTTVATEQDIVVGPGDMMSTVDEDRSCFRCAHTAVAQVGELTEWFKYDQIGAACVPRCGSCRCGKCPPGGKDMTLQEEKEVAIMEDCLTHKPEGDEHSAAPHWDTKYPYMMNPASLPDNYASVRGVLGSTLRRLERDHKWKEVYAAQIEDLVNREAARKLTEEEVKSWDGPVWYVAHQIAPNPHSKTTPCRLVWNSSQPCRGTSLNNILMKGPDFLNPIGNVLLRFRSGLNAVVGDIAKMYNSVFLEEKETHLHRFLWPNQESGNIETYVIQRLNIGDRPAACLAMLAMKLTAILPGNNYLEQAVDTVTKSTYVDDILDSTNSKEESVVLQQGIDEILRKGGFKVKAWIHSGESPTSSAADVNLPNAIKPEEVRALGLGYDVKEDKLYITSAVNFSKKMQRMHLGPNLEESQVDDALPQDLTKRIVLTQMMKLFDPIGLACPFKMKGAILFRKTWQKAVNSDGKPMDWDDPLPSGLRVEWLEQFQMMTILPSVKFERSLTVEGGQKPVLITFSDGSDNAYGAIAYVRWEVPYENPQVRLVEAKGKLCPLNLKGDTVKSEMCGAVFAVRMRKYLEIHCPIKFEKTYHFIDSRTVLGAINKEAYGFATFFANRVGEIRDASSPEDWSWIPSEENPADSITRGAAPAYLENAIWQTGPPWLCEDPACWPINDKVTKEDDQQVMSLMRKAFAHSTVRSGKNEDLEKRSLSLNEDISIEKYSSYAKVVRVVSTVKVLAGAWLRKQKPIKVDAGKLVLRLTPKDLDDAKLLLFQASQVELKEDNLKPLVARRDPGREVLVTSGRLGADLSATYEVPILPPCHLAELIAREEHDKYHEGVDSTVTHLRSKVWVIQGRRIVKKIVYRCVTCRKLRKKKLDQIMGDLPDCRITPNPAFSYTAVDLFGPIAIRGEVNKRSRMKVWGCVFSCLSSRAIYVDVARDYGTEGFLLVYRRFQAIRGSPILMFSDEGTHFVGASNELKLFRKSLEKDEIASYGANTGTEWRFHPPDAPHANGAVESMVKLVKKALRISVGSTVLSFSEIQTAFFEAAELVNERPLGIRGRDDGNLDYICPNQLLLGRSSPIVPQGKVEHLRNILKRYQLVQETIDKFWREWTKLSFPSVIVRRKWHVERRNLCEEDVVLISSEARGENRLGRVTKVYPDNRGRVRRVELRTVGPLGSRTFVVRDVRKLVLLLPVDEQC